MEKEIEIWIIWLAETIDADSDDDKKRFKNVTSFNYYDVIKSEKYLKIIRRQKLNKING